MVETKFLKHSLESNDECNQIPVSIDKLNIVYYCAILPNQFETLKCCIAGNFDIKTIMLALQDICK